MSPNSPLLSSFKAKTGYNLPSPTPIPMRIKRILSNKCQICIISTSRYIFTMKYYARQARIERSLLLL